MNKTLLPVLVAASLALAGCPKKEETKPAAPVTPAAPAPATPTSAPATGTDVVAEVKTSAVAAATAVVAEAKTSAAAATTQVTEQATAAVTQVQDQLKTELAAASKAALESTKTLLGNPQVSEPLKAELTKLADGLLGGKDGASAEALAKIVALKPTTEQMGFVKEIQSNVGVLVLGRNFDQNDPASGGAVKSAIDAIKAKDTAGIIAGLQKIGTSATLTPEQKKMAGDLLTSWSPALAGAVDNATKKLDAAKGALKGFGL